LLESLITSKTRVKLLLKFFLNPGTRAYLREIAGEFGESTNAIRIELNRLTKAKLLKSEPDGRIVHYRANKQHPLFEDIENVVKKYVGIDRLVDLFLGELGSVQQAFIIGDYAKGIDSGLIDLVVVGSIESETLDRLIIKTEQLISRKIRTLVLTEGELVDLHDRLSKEQILLLWINDSGNQKPSKHANSDEISTNPD